MNEQNTPTNSPEEPNRFEEELRQARASTQKLKKRILIVFTGMLIFAVVGLIAMALIDNWELENSGKEQETQRRPTTIIYYDPDYEYDVMQDEEYLELDRYIYYKDIRTNETIIIEDKAIENNSYGPAVKVLKKLVDAIIAGDHETYNSLFSSNYFKMEGNTPEEPFTMQQVYAIKFTRVNEADVIDDEFGRYTQYEFIVEYKIHKNNGTLHVGLDHDATLRRYFVLSNSTTNEVLIDQVGEYGYTQ